MTWRSQCHWKKTLLHVPREETASPLKVRTYKICQQLFLMPPFQQGFLTWHLLSLRWLQAKRWVSEKAGNHSVHLILKRTQKKASRNGKKPKWPVTSHHTEPKKRCGALSLQTWNREPGWEQQPLLCTRLLLSPDARLIQISNPRDPKPVLADLSFSATARWH